MPARGFLTRNKMVDGRDTVKRCPGGGRGLPFERSAGVSMDPGFRRERALMAVSFRAGRPQAGGELAMTAIGGVIATPDGQP